MSTDRKSTRLNSSHTVIYTLSLHDALPIFPGVQRRYPNTRMGVEEVIRDAFTRARDYKKTWDEYRSEERRVGKECRSLCDWSSDVCSSDLPRRSAPLSEHAYGR